MRVEVFSTRDMSPISRGVYYDVSGYELKYDKDITESKIILLRNSGDMIVLRFTSFEQMNNAERKLDLGKERDMVTISANYISAERIV